jgi:DNA replication protein DnaC
MVECTTMPDMTPSPDPTEPAPLADTLAPFALKLKAKGLEVGRPAPGPTPVPTEDPEDSQERRAARVRGFQTRWDEVCPAMYRHASLEDLDEQQQAARIRAWLHSGSLHLVLAGPVGTGKTHAAYAVGNQALEHGRGVEAWNVGDLLDALRPGSTDRDADRRARRAQLLILDDLVAKATDWEAERLTLLLDERVRHQRQTVVTTNITSQQISDTWGPRFMDRLRFRLTAVTLLGESRRGADW